MTEMKWERLWARKYSPFVASAFMMFFVKDRQFGYCGNKLFVPEGNLMAYYCEKSEIDALVKNYENFLRKQDMAEYSVAYEKEIEKLLLFAENIKNINPDDLDRDGLRTLLNRLKDEIIYSATYQFYAFAVLLGPATELEDKLSITPEGEKLMQIITTPYKHTQITRAHLELLKIAAEKDRSKLNYYATKYAWIPVYEPLDKPWTEGDFLEQYEQIKNPEDELSRAEKSQSENLAAYRKYLDTIEDNDFKKLVEIVHYFSYLKEMRDDYRRRAYWILQPFLTKLASVIGLSFDEINFLSLDEVLASISASKSVIGKEELAARQESFAYILNDGKLEIFSGQSAVEMGNKMLPESSSDLRGMIASRGVATGKVSIIYHQGEFAKFKEGDILVTTMTHPEFLPIMKKSSAIVTDEGGITCHAAIVARELGIPCIIGTKTATQVLKDGDIIEVDADKGTVIKIK
ncbi:MAG: PEP-utilizing enzyme [bacterium]|nr:PEP-utilizing enzyme [bacterium]